MLTTYPIIYSTSSAVLHGINCIEKNFSKIKILCFLDGLVIGADSLFVHKAHLAADRICYVDDILVDYRVNNPNSDVERAGNYLADISRTVDELYSVISGEDNHVIFLRSFDNWAIGKCLWIYKLRGDQIDPVLVDIVRRYDLSSRPKDYYYQVSARELLARIEINNL